MVISDKKLKRIVTEFRDGILGGRSSYLMCAAVCFPLRGFLSMCGIETEVATGDIGFGNHVWLQMADGRIIDPTIDQYSQYSWCPKGKVYIGTELPFYIRVLDDDDPIWTGATFLERCEAMDSPQP